MQERFVLLIYSTDDLPQFYLIPSGNIQLLDLLRPMHDKMINSDEDIPQSGMDALDNIVEYLVPEDKREWYVFIDEIISTGQVM